MDGTLLKWERVIGDDSMKFIDIGGGEYFLQKNEEISVVSPIFREISPKTTNRERKNHILATIQRIIDKKEEFVKADELLMHKEYHFSFEKLRRRKKRLVRANNNFTQESKVTEENNINQYGNAPFLMEIDSKIKKECEKIAKEILAEIENSEKKRKILEFKERIKNFRTVGCGLIKLKKAKMNKNSKSNGREIDQNYRTWNKKVIFCYAIRLCSVMTAVRPEIQNASACLYGNNKSVGTLSAVLQSSIIDFSSNFCNRENLPCMQYVNASQFISENHGNPERILANTGSSAFCGNVNSSIEPNSLKEIASHYTTDNIADETFNTTSSHDISSQPEAFSKYSKFVNRVNLCSAANDNLENTANISRKSYDLISL
ncbi:unnamed protein product [Dracunculus medinensis]|uniref:Uncharacterized protein n=1 Tax=Dracunculus medinensis TaxID=318479 RepID=A0A0N4UB23_DRAME|nr:unnamed protein product [Dracunculus medinensis]